MAYFYRSVTSPVTGNGSKPLLRQQINTLFSTLHRVKQLYLIVTKPWQGTCLQSEIPLGLRNTLRHFRKLSAYIHIYKHWKLFTELVGSRKALGKTEGKEAWFGPQVLSYSLMQLQMVPVDHMKDLYYISKAASDLCFWEKQSPHCH